MAVGTSASEIVAFRPTESAAEVSTLLSTVGISLTRLLNWQFDILEVSEMQRLCPSTRTAKDKLLHFKPSVTAREKLEAFKQQSPYKNTSFWCNVVLESWQSVLPVQASLIRQLAQQTDLHFQQVQQLSEARVRVLKWKDGQQQAGPPMAGLVPPLAGQSRKRRVANSVSEVSVCSQVCEEQDMAGETGASIKQRRRKVQSSPAEHVLP